MESNPAPHAAYETDPLMVFFTELAKVKDSPRSLVILTTAFLELLTETLIKKHCKHANKITKDTRTYPFSSRLLLLSELGVIDSSHFTAINILRDVRNEAAHDPFFDTTSSDVKRLLELSDPHAATLYNVCMSLFASFWNSHVTIFGPLFSPAILKSSTARLSTPSTEQPQK